MDTWDEHLRTQDKLLQLLLLSNNATNTKVLQPYGFEGIALRQASKCFSHSFHNLLS